MLHLARHLGLENEYIEISGLPSKGYEQSLKHFLLYSTDPGQASYSEIMDAKRRYMAREGKGAEGFWLTPKGLALYNLKLALRYGDDKAYEKYMAEYYDLGGTARGIRESIDRMHPLSGLSREDRRKFKSSLSDDQLNRLDKAMDFYNDTLRGGKQKR
jgi:hypothetical protein